MNEKGQKFAGRSGPVTIDRMICVLSGRNLEGVISPNEEGGEDEADRLDDLPLDPKTNA